MTNPFLTLPDHKISGEGVLDPIGVSTISDRLAEQVLPGLRARMSRPRFLTAMAVCAAVCDGIEDQVAADRVTPAYVVFEWLVVEGFARTAKREDTIYTPGMLKAQTVRDSGEPMRASAYLRSPMIFGFHGIYKPLARQAGIVDDDMRLGDQGYALVKEWQLDQGLAAFLPMSAGSGPGTAVRQLLRSAVDDALRKGYSDRSGQWRGWSVITDRLAPAKIGAREATFIHRILLDDRTPSRAEACRLIAATQIADGMSEAQLVQTLLLPMASPILRRRLQAIVSFENACNFLEDAFDWIRYLSSQAGARAITAKDFGANDSVKAIATGLPGALRAAEDAIANLDEGLLIQQDMARLGRAFDHIRGPEDLFEAVLTRHHDVQQAKAPDGKRDWFERNPDGATFVRVPYKATEPPTSRDYWNRPYRFDTVRSFLGDLSVGTYELASV